MPLLNTEQRFWILMTMWCFRFFVFFYTFTTTKKICLFFAVKKGCGLLFLSVKIWLVLINKTLSCCILIYSAVGTTSGMTGWWVTSSTLSNMNVYLTIFNFLCLTRVLQRIYFYYSFEVCFLWLVFSPSSQIFSFVVTLCYGCSMAMGFKRWRK